MTSELDIMARKSKKQTPEMAKFDTETAFCNYLQLPQTCHLATRHRPANRGKGDHYEWKWKMKLTSSGCSTVKSVEAGIESKSAA